ncbi:hypothetical protein Ddye_009396 [Dipteronia dyeriana]|uniref:Transposase MuDR plant domain-containing protein n=1 Tax=Dipteronia dyeriana TaxID=168575 RepID=A0AAD9XBB7_9ROSI|nr:hypothetical protein Ddye_009396 [Dipteronia dyeriana]
MVGQVFGNAKVFKEAVKEHAIKQGRSIWFPYNEKSRVQGVCKCKLDICSWSIWASCYEKNSPTLMIKTLNDKHTFPRVYKNLLANSTWLAKRNMEALRPGKEFKMFDFLEQWSKSHFRDWSKCDMLLNNLCESVNGDRVILVARSAHIFSMVEMIRVKIIKRRAKRSIDLEKWYQNIGLRVAEFMELQAQHSGQFVAHWGGEGHYQINRGSTSYAVVDLDQRTCTCRRWNLT